jgi:hypothetical protein
MNGASPVPVGLSRIAQTLVVAVLVLASFLLAIAAMMVAPSEVVAASPAHPEAFANPHDVILSARPATALAPHYLADGLIAGDGDRAVAVAVVPDRLTEVHIPLAPESPAALGDAPDQPDHSGASTTIAASTSRTSLVPPVGREQILTPAPLDPDRAALVQAVRAGGPAGVVSQLPASAFEWMAAHDWRVDWRQGPGPGRSAEAQYGTNTIVIWYEARRSNAFWVGALGHELGHAVSYVHFSHEQTDEWNAMRGLSSWRWAPATANDFSVGEGDFAEAFMSYLVGHDIRSVGGPLTPAQHAWIAANTPF